MKKPKPRSDEELRQLAVDIVEDRVFGSWAIPKSDDGFLLRSIFTVVALGGAGKILDRYGDDVAYLFEHLDKAAPRSINGYPIFFSCSVITREEWERLRPMLGVLQETREAFLEGRDSANL